MRQLTDEQYNQIQLTHIQDAQRIVELETENERLKAPISDEEWGVCNVEGFKEIDKLHRRMANLIIAARAESK